MYDYKATSDFSDDKFGKVLSSVEVYTICEGNFAVL
jgi:hypothetical protein